jgi:hypothetical protein
MSKPALPRPIGATVLALAALILAAVALPAPSLAAPPSSGSPLAATSGAFAKTTVRESSEKLTVEFSNVTEESLFVQNFGIEGSDAGDFTINEYTCGAVSSGASCTFGIYFTPQSVGEAHALLRLDFWNLPSEYVELSGTAVAAELTFAPPSHDFGIQGLHENGHFSFQLTNSGEATAALRQIEIPNPSGDVPFWTVGGTCQIWTPMQPGQSCALEVEFGPREVTGYSGELQVSFGSTDFSAALSGEGGRADVEATENPIDLGSATVGGAGPIQTITLTNSGNLPAAFFIGIVAGGDSGSFRLLDESCSGAELLPAASCVAHVQLTPQSPGPKVARLAFFGDGENGTMVMLHGEGIAAAVTLAPNAFDFGAQAAGGKSAAHSFAVRNEGGSTLDLDSVAIAGADLGQFALVGDECSGESLAPGSECLVRVRFAPDSAGAKTATLRVRGDAGTFTASLAGNGTAVGFAAAGGPIASATSPAMSQARPPAARRHRRHFARGSAIASASSRSHRADLRGGVVPR